MKKSFKRGSLVISLFIAFTPILIWWQRQQIFDWGRLYQYQPSSQIVELANATTMSDKGRHLFYVYHPMIESKDNFRNNCTENEHTIVLGCYVSRKGIYIYDVSDPRLNGVKEVTAAHEMLHAAYERLNLRDKKQIDKLLNDAYDKVTDQRIRGNIESYRKAGADVVNELHSILGTEVPNLPTGLETYYSRYFNDRAKIVNFSNQYKQAFDERQKKVEAADAKLAVLKSQIDVLQNSLQRQLVAIDDERSRMQALLSNEQKQAYNEAVPPFNSLVHIYNRDVNSVRNLIDEHNSIVVERNNVALEENQLIKAIDSRPDAVKSQ